MATSCVRYDSPVATWDMAFLLLREMWHSCCYVRYDSPVATWGMTFLLLREIWQSCCYVRYDIPVTTWDMIFLLLREIWQSCCYVRYDSPVATNSLMQMTNCHGWLRKIRTAIMNHFVFAVFGVLRSRSCEILGFRHEVDENSALLGYYAASSDVSGLQIPSSMAKRNYQHSLRNNPDEPKPIRTICVNTEHFHFHSLGSKCYSVEAAAYASRWETQTWFL
jgi:hypothetical protein